MVLVDDKFVLMQCLHVFAESLVKRLRLFTELFLHHLPDLIDRGLSVQLLPDEGSQVIQLDIGEAGLLRKHLYQLVGKPFMLDPDQYMNILSQFPVLERIPMSFKIQKILTFLHRICPFSKPYVKESLPGE